MKFSPDRGFLHPVLGQQEYHYPCKTFTCKVDGFLNKVTRSFEFSAKFKLDVDAINNLIDEGQAICMLWVYSSATSHRGIFKADSSDAKGGKDGKRNVKGSISLDLLRGNLELHPQVVAISDLELPLTEANQVFGEVPRKISPGSPLAVHFPTVTLLGDYDSNVKSMIVLKQDELLAEGAWDIRIDPKQPYIELVAGPDTHEAFQRLRSNDSTLTLQTLCLAALVDALTYYLKWDGFTRDDSGTWVGVVTSKLKAKGIQVSQETDQAEGVFELADSSGGSPRRSLLWVAQKILEEPLSMSSILKQHNQSATYEEGALEEGDSNE